MLICNGFGIYFFKLRTVFVKVGGDCISIERLKFLFNFTLLSKFIKNIKFFYKVNVSSIELLFVSKLVYVRFFKFAFGELKFNVYFFKVFVKGLGYELERVSGGLIKIFLGFNHFYYIHVPKFIYVRRRKLSLLFLSLRKDVLNKFFLDILFLKRLDLFFKKEKLSGVFSKRRLFFLIPKKIVSGYF